MSLHDRARLKAEEARRNMINGSGVSGSGNQGQGGQNQKNGRNQGFDSRKDNGNNKAAYKYADFGLDGSSEDLVSAREKTSLAPSESDEIAGMRSGATVLSKDASAWLKPRRREYIQGVIVGRAALLGRMQVPGGIGRWMRSLFAGTPYARRASGVAFVMKRPEGTETLQVIAYGDTAAAMVATGAQVRVRGRVNGRGELIADDVVSVHTGLPVVQGRMSAARVRISTLLGCGCVFGSIKLVKSMYTGAVQTIADSAANSEAALSRFFAGADDVGIGLLGAVVVFGILMYGVFMALTGRYR